MPIAVTDLKPGERVMLNCPRARVTKREAVFQGIFQSLEDVMAAGKGVDAIIMGSTTPDFLESRGHWARFLLQRVSGEGPKRMLEYPGGGAINLPPFNGETDLVAGFLIEPDGGMREEEGRRIFIERRMTMGQG